MKAQRRVTGSRAALYQSDLQADTISSEFNNTERDMNKQELQTSKQASWHNHLARYAASGKSIAAFCRDEAISQANFHVWRIKLANAINEGVAVPMPTPGSTFIDTTPETSSPPTRIRRSTRSPPCTRSSSGFATTI